MGGEVVAVWQGRAARAPVQRIAHQAAPARIGAVDPELELVLTDIAIEVKVGDPGLYQGEGVLLADLEDAVHPAKLEDHTARQNRGGSAVCQILAG